jgi:two-component sensor histidine kinase
MRPGRTFTWTFAFVAALVVTCLFTLASMGSPDAPPFALLHSREVYALLAWFLLVPPIIAVARRFPFGEGSPFGWLLRHLGFGVVFGAASLGIAIGLRAAVGTVMGMDMLPQLAELSPASIVARLATGVLVYALIAVAYQAVTYHRTAREREGVANRLRADLAEAKLAIVEGQLHPHFLFNALNSVAALVRVDPAQAESMIEQLSELLRATLRKNPMQEVSLDEVLHLAERYLAIEQVRFGPRLRVAVEATVDARRARVPQLILQPLVENAVRHGIAPLEEGGSVTVRATVDAGRLLLTVNDDGVGYGQSAARPGSGLGINSVRSLLSQLYGSEQSFDVAPAVPRGTQVSIILPLRSTAA